MRRTVLVLLVLLGAMAVPAPASAAVIATCGATLTEDAYLVRDLSCPAGGGLTLTDGVTLDLRGHRLVGPGPAAGTGITVAHDASVTVTGGRVQRWGTGLALNSSSGSTVTVERVAFAGNGSGIEAAHGIFRVHDSRFADNGTGLSVFQSQVEITRSRFVRNSTGVSGDEDSPIQVTDSVFTGNGTAAGSENARLIRTTIRYGTYGVYGGGTVRDSVIAHVTTAIHPTGGYRGIVDVSGTRFIGNRTAIPITGIGTRVFVRSSVFRGNGDGVTVTGAPEFVTVLLEGNTFVRNGNGIIGTAPPTVELRANRADRNLGWGINLPGAVDLGGNTARGNGRSPQCVGVVCT